MKTIGNRKDRKLRNQIIGAVAAVLLTTCLGTAALASSEPAPASDEMSGSAFQQRDDSFQDRGPAPELPMDENAPAPEGEAPADRPEARPENDAPSGEPGEQPENGQPSGEPGEHPENGQPSGEPGERPENGQPSGEPGERPENGQPSGEPGEQPENGAPSGDPGARPEENQSAAPEQRDENPVVAFFRNIMNSLANLLGIGPKEDAPAQVSPDFGGAQDASGEMGQPSGEMAGTGGAQSASGEMRQASGEMGGSASGEPSSYAAANTLTQSASGASYASASGDENAVLVSGDTVTLSGVTVSKTGSSSGESADFYGVNAGVLATGGAVLTIEDADITTDGTHANGVFSYGSGTTVNISDSTISTGSNNSGGIMTTGGGTMNAVNLTVSTAGNSSAAIRTDRGGGSVIVTEGSYATAGAGSPAVYSTADITVSDAVLTAAASEAVVIEGGNSVTLYNSDVTGNNSVLNGQSTQNTNVLIYQSMSGDAAEGSSVFTMTGGSMTAGTGSMFHVTNVATEINLSGVDFTYADDSGVFLDASADSWGTAGKNGGDVTLNLDGQDITGVITQDSVSSVAVNLENGSTWTLTGYSYITSLSGDTAGIDTNGYTLYVNGTAWNG